MLSLRPGARNRREVVRSPARVVSRPRTAQPELILDETSFYRIALWGLLALSPCIATLLFFVSAPYGRHARPGWGPAIPSKVAWFLMELPAVATIAVCWAVGDRRFEPVSLVLLGIWELHYLNRTFVYPFRRRGEGRPMPISVAGMALLFNVWNGYLNGRWLFSLGPRREIDWLWDPRFVVGAALFLVGFAINQHSDSMLLRLRRPGERGYRVPRGGLFSLVTMPNYLGELIEWIGWAVATWSPAGAVFAVFTAANLVPRAWTNRRWYRERFDDYPPERKAIIPFVF
jgi:3-oxo-5-alpha-steroid 4-dehydrogenase 1